MTTRSRDGANPGRDRAGDCPLSVRPAAACTAMGQSGTGPHREASPHMAATHRAICRIPHTVPPVGAAARFVQGFRVAVPPDDPRPRP